MEAERRDEDRMEAERRENASPRRAQVRPHAERRDEKVPPACLTISPTCSAFGTPAILHIDRDPPHHKKPPKEIFGSFF
ncbi:MAG: hypothetical protein DRH43_04820 [Deltaproteobacteria bacterium]|nr:MAG: hypothetical protein DRH43_04820 [Deltaproteobacteria bacterium]